MDIESGSFVWDTDREAENVRKHGIGFCAAAKAFDDPRRKIFEDLAHNRDEARQYCIGLADGRVLTVRFVFRDGKIRIFGAGYWRKGRGYYDKA